MGGYVKSLETIRSDLALKTADYNDVVARISEVTDSGKWVGLSRNAEGSSQPVVKPTAAWKAATQAGQNLFDVQERIAKFQQTTELTLLKQRLGLKRELLGSYLRELEAAQNNVAVQSRTLAALEEEIKGQPQFLVLVKAIEDTALWQQLGLDPSSVTWQRLRELGLQTEEVNPVFVSLTNQISALRASIETDRERTTLLAARVDETRNEVKSLEQEIAQAELQLARLQTELSLAEQDYTKQKEYFSSLIAAEADLRNELRSLETQRGETERLLEEARGEVQRLERAIVEKEAIRLPRLRDELALSVETYDKEKVLFSSLQAQGLDLRNRVRTLQTEQAGYQKLVDIYQQDINALSARIAATELQVQQYDRQSTSLKESLAGLAPRLQEARIAKEEQTGSIRVVEQAVEPQAPVGPNQRMNVLLGAALGLALGVGAAFVVHYVRP
ncbi:MAG: hypothetical protein HYY31_02495 [Chloroflexi bacterium]|nr:hypothetical protein [Chloroflexota bacterium]